LVTSKSGEIEPQALIEQRLEEAAKFVRLEQLCLSPQCGFASTEEGNLLTETEQWLKLRLVVDTANVMWPEAPS
jgi:5-methyltetrahydropteroyltriglutamate--homocysteine methyltransferase